MPRTTKAEREAAEREQARTETTAALSRVLTELQAACDDNHQFNATVFASVSEWAGAQEWPRSDRIAFWRYVHSNASDQLHGMARG